MGIAETSVHMNLYTHTSTQLLLLLPPLFGNDRVLSFEGVSYPCEGITVLVVMGREGGREEMRWRKGGREGGDEVEEGREGGDEVEEGREEMRWRKGGRE